jgi:aspartate carbamoyltransferase catalytic subunit
MSWIKKHLLQIQDLTCEEIETILDIADSFKEVSTRAVKKVPTLRGKTVVNLFFEPSTRTRVSFELAEKRLSADTINIVGSSSSTVKGETLIDTVKNIKALHADVVVIRHSLAGAAQHVAGAVDVSVVNAGDGAHAHPTQALLDAYTIRQHKKSFKNLRVTIVGDIAHSRVARSNIWALTKLGAKVSVVGPATMIPKEIENMGVDVCYDLKEGVANADVVLMLRIQRERQNKNYFPSLREYAKLYGLRRDSLTWMKKDALIMHPGPVNLGVELSEEVAHCKQSLILDQVTNGVAVRMAVLYLVGSVQKETDT